MQNNQSIGFLQYNIQHKEREQNKFTAACAMNFTLLDEKGRVVFEKNINQSPSNTPIQLTTPLLKVGRYNAWVQAEGKTYLRQLNIEKAPMLSWVEKINHWMFPRNTSKALSSNATIVNA